jgi:hypothetical protein
MGYETHEHDAAIMELQGCAIMQVGNCMRMNG